VVIIETVPPMKNFSQPRRSGELSSQNTQVELMHQQDSASWNNRSTTLSGSYDSETVLQQIAQTLRAFRVDYCLVMVAVDDQVTGQIFYWYFDKHLVVPWPK